MTHDLSFYDRPTVESVAETAARQRLADPARRLRAIRGNLVRQMGVAVTAGEITSTAAVAMIDSGAVDVLAAALAEVDAAHPRGIGATAADLAGALVRNAPQWTSAESRRAAGAVLHFTQGQEKGDISRLRSLFDQ